jgi:quercetin dioxygenase-like cupin family protein
MTRLQLLPCLLLGACVVGPDAPSRADPVVASPGLILQEGEGERRVRRMKPAGAPGLSGPFILKVDRANGGSPDLVMGYEELAPGEAIAAHRHLRADEIVFVHTGTGLVSLGEREARIGRGGTIYIPRNVRIALRNDGNEPLGIAFFFSHPGFEELMRDNSVREGEPAPALSAAEQAAIQARHAWHTVRTP